MNWTVVKKKIMKLLNLLNLLVQAANVKLPIFLLIFVGQGLHCRLHRYICGDETYVNFYEGNFIKRKRRSPIRMASLTSLKCFYFKAFRFNSSQHKLLECSKNRNRTGQEKKKRIFHFQMSAKLKKRKKI